MKTGIWVTILGIIVILIGGAMYAAGLNHIIGGVVAIVGLIVLVVGVALWTWPTRTAPKPTPPQPSQPSQPAKAP